MSDKHFTTNDIRPNGHVETDPREINSRGEQGLGGFGFRGFYLLKELVLRIVEPLRQ